MVAKACQFGRSISSPSGGWRQLDIITQSTINYMDPISPRNSIGPTDFARLSRSGGSEEIRPSISHDQSVFGTLVRDIKTRKGQNEAQTYHKLPKIEHFFETKTFRLDHLHNISPYLKKGQWAAKIDLKDAYFHLPLGEDLRPYVRLQVGRDVWEFQASCFGLNVLPQKFMLVMKTFEKICHKRGILCFIYLDDILL